MFSNKGDTKDYIQLIIQEVKGCFLDKSYSFKVPVDKLDTILEYLKQLERKIRNGL